jgi:putative spermidine/putrescine transport system substrate-binding protein
MKRNLVSAATVLSAALVCGGASAETLTFVSYAGQTQQAQIDAWQKPYTAKTGTDFRNDAPPDGIKLKAMVEAKKVSWDVMDQGAPFAEQHCGTLLEKIDRSQLKESQFPKGSVTDCGVPIYFYGLTVVYNKKKFGNNPPKKVEDFFDLKNFPGMRAVPPDLSNGTLEYALLADGVPIEKLYPLDVDRALKKLDTIKSSIIFASTNGVLQQSVVDEQADMAFMPTGRFAATLAAGAQVAAIWDRTIMNWDSLMIPKGTPNAKEAMKFIAFATDPERNAGFVERASIPAANLEAKPTYSAMQNQVDPTLNKKNGAVVFLADAKWWAENLDKVNAKLTPWKSR